ncbi:MAG: hypothetical protein M1381_00885 [Deltaproteobacteria bacterium]|nr:hypothetical protein [Deltaproteobacteria bacterium]MCL5792200.1 hypothetical protein [Deltaproteobacteria bacterium]
MARKKAKTDSKTITPVPAPPLIWIKAAYKFHTYAYRDPRSAFASAMGSPVVSPTTVLLGIASTLFSIGKACEAKAFLDIAQHCKVVVDAPDGVIFFRAFHQLRRYETGEMKVKKEKYKPNERIGLTKINQGTREYGLVEGQIILYVGIPEEHYEAVKLALTNLGHFGTHDSMCSLIGNAEKCSKPDNVVYIPPEQWETSIPSGSTAVTLSRFKNDDIKPTLSNWWMAGGENTERVQYFIKGKFEGTSRGKIYKKH